MGGAPYPSLKLCGATLEEGDLPAEASEFVDSHVAPPPDVHSSSTLKEKRAPALAVDLPNELPAPPLPPDEVTPSYHRNFLLWISFLRAGEIDEAMTSYEWAFWLGQKLSLLNWKLIGQRKGVDTSADNNMESVLRLAGAYELAGRPHRSDPSMSPLTSASPAEYLVKE